MGSENNIQNEELEQVISPQEEIPAETTENTPSPAPEAEPIAEEADAEAEPIAEEADAEAEPIAEEADAEAELAAEQRGKQNRIFRGALRFYAFFYAGILAVLILLCCLMLPIRTLLTQYEQAQPQYAAQNIYELLFENPDWALLYDMADVEGTDYEGRSAYVTYMTKKVGNRKLTCHEVAGTSEGTKRFSIRLGKEEVASFTMCTYDDGVSTFPLWTLDVVDVYFTREESVSIIKMPEHTVYINGVPLDDSHTILYVNTVAENYLSEELDGYHYVQQKLDGLLVHPDIVVVDEYNNPLPLTRNPVTGVYSTEIPSSPAMTDEERAWILDAAHTELMFAIRDISAVQLRQHFETGSPAYTALNQAEPVLNKFQSYRFLDEEVVIRDFYRYSDTVFSVRVNAKMEVTVKKNKTEIIEVDTTYIFTQNNAGKYMVTESIPVDLQEVITSVLLHYECDGELLGSFIVDTHDTTPAAPTLPDRPDGKFLGWGMEGADGQLTLVLIQDADGLFHVAEGQQLVPATLYPVYGSPEEA